MKTEASDPVYPNDRQWPSPTSGSTHPMGMTKREYFAAMAMQGMAANGNHYPEIRGDMAVQQADALIRALNK